MNHWGKPESDPLQFLTGPEKLKWFLEECWEKKHHVFKANELKRKAFDGLFTCDSLDAVMKDREAEGGEGPLEFGVDLNAAKYVNGVRETPNGEVGDAKTVWALFKKGVTLQFIQPQRFDTNLQALCAALESRLGCLVGCNAYLTPKGTQGLAPHHDEVELFVCQTQGSKTWRIHKPVNNYKLPSEPSGNLSQEVAGQPIEEVTLHIGDVLYMPRGTVHQAVAQDGTSVHLTISTYQRWSWGDLTVTILQHAMAAKEEAVGAPLALREGLPIGFINNVGSLTGAKQTGAKYVKELCKRLREFADDIEEKESLLQMGVDSMAEDVCSNRMPPVEEQLLDKGRPPVLDSFVKPRGKGLFRLMPVQSDIGDTDPNLIQLISCMKNPVQSHMISTEPVESDDDLEEFDDVDCCTTTGGTCCPGIEKPGAEASTAAGDHSSGSDSEESDDGHHVLVFEKKYAPTLQNILGCDESGICVSELPLTKSSEKINLVRALWEDGIIATVGKTDSTRVKKAKRTKRA